MKTIGPGKIAGLAACVLARRASGTERYNERHDEVDRRRLSLEKDYIRILTASDLSKPRGGLGGDYPSDTECGNCGGGGGE